MMITLIRDHESLKLTERIITMMHRHGIRYHSHRWDDYERAKSDVRLWNLPADEYDQAIKQVTEYLDL